VAFFKMEDIWSMRFGTVAAAPYNSQRTNRNQRVMTWTDFFNPQTSRQRPVTTSLEEQRKKFLNTLKIRQEHG
jgi:hypothetical protein